MKFTESEILLSGNAKICAEGESGDKGYTTPQALGSILNGSLITPSVNTDYEVPLPEAGTTDGQAVKYHVVSASGGNLTLAAGIVTPSDSMITFPKVMTAGALYIVRLEWGNGHWNLTTIVGGFVTLI